MAKVITRTMEATSRCFHISSVCSKNYVMRKPVRVLNLPTTKDVTPRVQTVVGAPIKGSALPAPVLPELPPEIIKKPEEYVVPYEKLSKYDGRFIKTIQMIKSRKEREKTGKILLEGKRLINDAIEAGIQMKALYFSREEDLRAIKIKDPNEVEVCKVLYRTLKVWSGLTTCPGVMAVFNRPDAEDLYILSHSTIPVTVLCDNVRDPGNLGSIIRNAAAAGCTNILLTKGCVDPWEMKVLRAGCGGHFRIPIVNNIEWSQVSNYIPSTSTIFVADNSAEIDFVDLSEGFINPDDIEERKEAVELDKENNEAVEEEEVEEKKYYTINEHDQPIRVDESFDSKTELEKFEDVPLPCHLYCGVKYPKKNIVLVVGGETTGIDSKIIKLACEFGGRKVKIPMENGMDSMNSAFALTIILYEIKRQMVQTYVTK